jgi:flagellar basal-body rod modification protein FlgD
MTTIDPKNTGLDGLTSSTTPKRQATKELGQEQFLELMMAQLKNQDPMKPMQNGEFLSQMAQFGTVNGIQDLQKTFSGLASSLQSNQALMASSLVGRSVLAPAASAQVAAGSRLLGATDLAQPATNVVVNVTDAAGALVKRIDLGPQSAGEVRFQWDGTLSNGAPAPAGRYTLSAQAQNGRETLALNTLLEARVDSVSLGGANGLSLNLAGLGPVNLADVRQIS